MTAQSAQPSRRCRSRWRFAVAGAVATVTIAGTAVALSAQSGGSAQAADALTTTSPSGGFSPQMLQRAYGVSPLLQKGIDGRGETVVLPEVGLSGGGLTNIHQDLAAFDKRYHLPRVDLTVSRVLGFTGNPAGAQLEEAIDAEMVHSIAPEAKIEVMLSGSHAFAPPALGSLLRAAAGRGNIVSLSYNECERCLSAGALRSLNRALAYARNRHVSVIAITGDFGSASGGGVDGPSSTRGVAAPASNPLVTAVGGTTLATHPDGAWAGESAWNEDVHPPVTATGRRFATGGGVSVRFTRPGYQNGLPGIGDHRGVPDVAAVADPGLATLLNLNGQPATGPGGGTSAAAPLWAAIAALADQFAHRQLGFLNQGLYRIGESPEYHHAFHDITDGDNTLTLRSGTRINGYRARPGWDPVTGWGSPNAQILVPLLRTAVHPDDGRGL